MREGKSSKKRFTLSPPRVFLLLSSPAPAKKSSSSPRLTRKSLRAPPRWLPRLQSAACLLLWWGVRGPGAVHGPGVGPEDHSGSVGALHLPLLDLEAIAGQQLPGHHHEGLLHVLALLRSQIQV